jgi:hypothetical protein
MSDYSWLRCNPRFNGKGCHGVEKRDVDDARRHYLPRAYHFCARSQPRSSRWLRWKINGCYEHTSSKHSKTIKKQYPRTSFERELEQALLSPFEFETVTRGPSLGLVTPHGILQLAKIGLIPSISKIISKERSKANFIAKIFVLSQII